jgi:hypothetical protein
MYRVLASTKIWFITEYSIIDNNVVEIQVQENRICRIAFILHKMLIEVNLLVLLIWIDKNKSSVPLFSSVFLI